MNFFAVAAALLLLAGPVQAERFAIRAGKEGSLVRFVSKAAMESFEGKTHEVTGDVSLDTNDLGDSLAISVVVDMATLDTGIALRNQHMRENHLHTKQFPTATFSGGRIVEGSGVLAAGVVRRVLVEGALAIHGVTRQVTLPLDLTWDGADQLNVNAEFSVALADHEIARPKFLLLKLGETQKVVVALVADRSAPPSADTSPAPDADSPTPD